MSDPIAEIGKAQCLDQLICQIDNNKKYDFKVFWAPGIYFSIINGKIITISNDASCSPRGGWFPPIVTGPSDTERAFLREMMDEWHFDETFFDDILECYGEFHPDYALEYFEENEDEEAIAILKELEYKINSKKAPFESIEAFVSALRRIDLEPDELYYEWEDIFVHFYNNIWECGEDRGTYEDLTVEEWIEILENIDDHVVTAD